MILYNEKANHSEHPLVFLKTDGGKRIPQIVSTVVENNINIPGHKNGMCDVKAMVICTKGLAAGEGKCYVDGRKIYLPDGEEMPVKILSVEPFATIGFNEFAYATFTCSAHYE